MVYCPYPLQIYEKKKKMWYVWKIMLAVSAQYYVA